jgi:hypothetical protein
MMIVHEAGHVAGAVLTGGRVRRVVLTPVGFSRTDVMPDPRPLIVVWAGPVVGAAAPLCAWAIAEAAKVSVAYLLRFFAGFCLIANGAYIGAGSFGRVGDAYPMLLFGSSMWQLWLFGLLTAPAGLLLWHRLGPHFGLGANPLAVSRRHVRLMCVVLIAIVGAELAMNQGWRA